MSEVIPFALVGAYLLYLLGHCVKLLIEINEIRKQLPKSSDHGWGELYEMTKRKKYEEANKKAKQKTDGIRGK